MGRFADLLGTLSPSFGIGPKGARATLDSSGLTADRALALPDGNGTLALAGIPIRPTQAVSNYTFVLADANTCTPFSAGANAAIPLHSAVAFPIGTRLYVQGASVGIIESTGNILVSGLGRTKAAGEWQCAIQNSIDNWSVYPFIASAFQLPSVTDDSFSAIQFLLAGNDLFRVPLTNNVTTITIQQLSHLVTPSPYGTTFAARFEQPTSGGPYTVAFPSSFHFLTGSDTAIQSGAGAFTMLAGTTFDGGTRWECVMRACGA